MQTVAIYVRVSTTKQEMENQLIQLQAFVEKSKWYVYKEYCDVISGKENSRPAFDRLFADAHKKLFDIVLFWDLSRFSRSGTLFTLQKLRELERIDIQWHSYQDPFFSSLGEFKDVVISILATLAKIEREKISERTKAGLERAKEQGKKIGRTSIPKETVQDVLSLLQQDISLTYAEISKLVTYKIGRKKYNISPASITKIKQTYL